LRYAVTHVTVEFVIASKLVTAFAREVGPVLLKLGVRHSLRDGPAAIGAPDAT
jgi:hypothetical protein